ncbi:MAG: putative transporter ATP-binding protein [Ilumatobacteraceae bacterium]|nr:putative transporter ATP-binding protein [Ilumatobacteraceae bacterium]
MSSWPSPSTPSPSAPSPSTPVVQTAGVVKEYANARVLDGIDLAVDRGHIVGLIGPSGCGKTTLVRLLTGITAPTSGEVKVFGSDPTRFPASTRSRFGYMPQLPVLFPTLSVWGNLTFMSSVYGQGLRHRRRRLGELLELVELNGDRRKLLAHCSGGMQRRLALAAVLVHRPELLFLDEPTAGVDPILRARFWDHFRGLRDRGATLIVPTQYVGEAAMCDQVAVMSAGRLVTVLPPTELRRFAYGGDVVCFSMDEVLQRADVQRLAAVPGVREVRRTDVGLRFVVDDEARDVVAIEQALAGLGVTTASVEPFDPSYEDVFVAIIERDRAARGADAASAA